MQEHCGLIKINVTAAFKDTENSAQLGSDGGKTQTDATTTTCRPNVMRPNAQVIVYLGCYIVTRASTLAAVVEVKLLVQNLSVFVHANKFRLIRAASPLTPNIKWSLNAQ